MIKGEEQGASSLPAAVVERFAAAWARRASSGALEPTAVTLATADALGRPSARVVLLKRWDAQGFVIFTNLESRKGVELRENPHAALVFYWPELEEQLRVEGRAEMIEAEASDAYWVTRPRGSQVGAWASTQSRPMREPGELEARVATFTERFDGAPVPRPPHWGGVRIVPSRVEFWRMGASRLHEREVWELADGRWQVRSLFLRASSVWRGVGADE